MDWSNVTFLVLDSLTMFTEPRSQGLSSFLPLEEGRREALETRLPLSAFGTKYPTNTLVKIQDKKLESV